MSGPRQCTPAHPRGLSSRGAKLFVEDRRGRNGTHSIDAVGSRGGVARPGVHRVHTPPLTPLAPTMRLAVPPALGSLASTKWGRVAPPSSVTSRRPPHPLPSCRNIIAKALHIAGYQSVCDALFLSHAHARRGFRRELEFLSRTAETHDATLASGRPDALASAERVAGRPLGLAVDAAWPADAPALAAGAGEPARMASYRSHDTTGRTQTLADLGISKDSRWRPPPYEPHR